MAKKPRKRKMVDIIQQTKLVAPDATEYAALKNYLLYYGLTTQDQPSPYISRTDDDANRTITIVNATMQAVFATEIVPLPAETAVALLTHTGTALNNNETITIGDRVYTFKTALTGAANEVIIGAATASLTNLKAAVNGGEGAGTIYGVGTAAHADVTATTLTVQASPTLRFEAKVAGAAGNAIATAEASLQLSWGATTFLDGVDAVF